MGVRILHDGPNDMAALYCSTSDWAFGPVFSDSETHSAEERAESFCRWLYPADPREYSDSGLESKYSEWRRQEEAQWKAEEALELDTTKE